MKREGAAPAKPMCSAVYRSPAKFTLVRLPCERDEATQESSAGASPSQCANSMKREGAAPAKPLCSAVYRLQAFTSKRRVKGD